MGGEKRHLHVHLNHPDKLILKWLTGWLSGKLDKPSSVKNSENKKEGQSDGDEYYQQGRGGLLHPTGHRLHGSSHGRYWPRGRGGDGIHTDSAGLLVKYLPHLTFANGYRILGCAFVHTGSELHALVPEILSRCHPAIAVVSMLRWSARGLGSFIQLLFIYLHFVIQSMVIGYIMND